MSVLKKKFKSQIYCETADFNLIKKFSSNLSVKGFYEDATRAKFTIN